VGRKRRKPASGCVLPRASAKHGTVYQIRWRVNNGPARYETVGPDRAEAEQALALRLAEINGGSWRERRDVTFHEFASQWFDQHRPGLKPSAVERLRNDLEVHLLPFFGDYLVHQIGAELVDRYKAEKLLDGRLGASSVNKTLTELGQVLRAAVRYDYIDRNPVEQVKRCKIGRRTPAFLELDQVEPFIAATPEQHRMLMMVLVGAGLRIGEALALRWRDVDLLATPPRLNITRTWDPTSPDPETGTRGVEVAVKSGEEGSVTIGDRLLRDLLDHKALGANTDDKELVFPSRGGTHLNPSNLRARSFRKAVARANARLVQEEKRRIPEGLTPHGLRHTYCSLLVAQGADVATVAAQMRHADLTTTLRYYTHAQQHLRKAAADAFDAAVWGQGDRVLGRKRVAGSGMTAALATGDLPESGSTRGV
jgi:integrase